MADEIKRAEIVVNGLVQGVGYRYFVYKNAVKLGLNGVTKNLYTGEVFTIAEGEKIKLDEFFNILKIGPMHAHVKSAHIKWCEPKYEFSNFEIVY